MPPLTLLIKPASGNCNLMCKYCFYRDIADNREHASFGMMTQETLRQLVKRAFAEAEGSVTFAFQGGEPTLAGIGFFKSFIALVGEYNDRALRVSCSIQTNGLLLDEEWAAFFKENAFLVGLSLDGPRELHELNRVDGAGRGSFDRVMGAARLLERYGVPYNILCVVTKRVARHAGEVYRFFKSRGFRYLQFIPCLDPLGEESGGKVYSLTSEDYTAFLKTTFDRWAADLFTEKAVSIRQFENYVQMLKGYPPESCGMSGRCACYFVVEADGGVYPCDFYVLDRWRLGDVFTDSFRQMREGDTAREFTEGSALLDPRCKACRWYALCRGGCRRDRESVGGNLTANRFCRSYAAFFEYALPRLQMLARQQMK